VRRATLSPIQAIMQRRVGLAMKGNGAFNLPGGSPGRLPWRAAQFAGLRMPLAPIFVSNVATGWRASARAVATN